MHGVRCMHEGGCRGRLSCQSCVEPVKKSVQLIGSVQTCLSLIPFPLQACDCPHFCPCHLHVFHREHPNQNSPEVSHKLPVSTS